MLRAWMIAGGLLLAACGGAGGGDASTGEPAPPTATIVATEAETQWVRELCVRDARYSEEENGLPERAVDPETLSLEQRKERAVSLWSKMVEIDERYIAEMAGEPPERMAAMQFAITVYRVSRIEDHRRSLADADAIFSSIEEVAQNNTTLEAAEESRVAIVDRALHEDAGVLALYRSLPECAE